MSRKTILIIQESATELKQLFRKHPYYLHPRIEMLYLLKTNFSDSPGILATKLLVTMRSVQFWQKAYAQGGIEQLLSYERGKHKSNGIITPAINEQIVKRLSSPTSAFTSYIDLQQWLQENHLPTVSYRVVHHHAHTKLKASLKVARKSHIKKDDKAVEDFKKV